MSNLGVTFDEALDGPRLRSLLGRVLQIMSDGEPHTLAELAARAGGSEAGCSARIRELRAGGHEIATTRVSGGLWQYRLRIEPVQRGLAI